jgi:hypothetical protein
VDDMHFIGRIIPSSKRAGNMVATRVAVTVRFPGRTRSG